MFESQNPSMTVKENVVMSYEMSAYTDNQDSISDVNYVSVSVKCRSYLTKNYKGSSTQTVKVYKYMNT
jgi:hypothetical protein